MATDLKNHPSAYRPYYKDDERLRETIRKEQRSTKAFPLTDLERTQAIAHFPVSIRPRPALDSLVRGPRTSSGEAFEQVQLMGLTGRSELNGALGMVVDTTPDDAGRITVRLDPGAGSKLFRVSRERLRSAGGGSSSPAGRMSRAQSAGELAMRTSASTTVGLQSVPKQMRGFARKANGGFYHGALGLHL